MCSFFCNSSCCECWDCPKRDDWWTAQLLRKCTRPTFRGLNAWTAGVGGVCDGGGGGVCGWKGRKEGKERGRRGVGVGCVGMGGVCGMGEERRREGGRGRWGGNWQHRTSELTEAILLLFSDLTRHFHRIRNSFEMLPLVQTLSRLLWRSLSWVFPSHVFLGGCRVSWNKDKIEAVSPCFLNEHNRNCSQHPLHLHC